MNIQTKPDLLAILSNPHPQPQLSHPPRYSQPKSHKNNEEQKINKLALGGLHDDKFKEQEEIKKWIEARKRRFPSRWNKEKDKLQDEKSLSVLEKKLRTKLLILKDESPHEKAEKRRQKR
jgi:hypothetical protein